MSLFCRPVWVDWNLFLDNIARDDGYHGDRGELKTGYEPSEGDMTPTGEPRPPMHGRTSTSGSNVVHDAVVDVIVASQKQVTANREAGAGGQTKVQDYVTAKMIITVWELGEDKFFTLSFTSNATSDSAASSDTSVQARQVRPPRAKGILSRTGTSTGRSHTSESSPSSVTSGKSSYSGSRGSNQSSVITSPTSANMSHSPFPPLGPPSRSGAQSAPSSLQKLVRMKDALMDFTATPIVIMWHDSSLTLSNAGSYLDHY